EKAVRQSAALNELDLARVSNPKMGCGFFLLEWPSQRVVTGSPNATLKDLEDYLRSIAAPEPPKPKQPAKFRRRGQTVRTDEEAAANDKAANECLATLIDNRTLKAMAGRYRLTVGQVRGLIARHGVDEVTLATEAEKLRRDRR